MIITVSNTVALEALNLDSPPRRTGPVDAITEDSDSINFKEDSLRALHELLESAKLHRHVDDLPMLERLLVLHQDKLHPLLRAVDSIDNGALKWLLGLPGMRIDMRPPALGYAAVLPTPDLLSTLIEHGASVNIACEQNPLHMALYAKQYGNIRRLLRAGANLTHKTPSGVTVWSILMKGGYTDKERSRVIRVIAQECDEPVCSGGPVPLLGRDWLLSSTPLGLFFSPRLDDLRPPHPSPAPPGSAHSKSKHASVHNARASNVNFTPISDNRELAKCSRHSL